MKNRNLSSHYPIKRMVGVIIALARMHFGVFLCLMFSLTIMEAWGDGSVSYSDNLMANHKADYVIIVPEPFYNSDAIRRLANWRAQYSGLDVVVVSTTRIYDNFSGLPAATFAAQAGALDESIRSFIQHIYDSWDAGHISDGHVGYILLVGDVEFLPVHISEQESIDEKLIATDNWYACVSGDDLMPDIMLGRFPAKNKAELNIMIDKTIQYEQEPLYGEWSNNVLLMSGMIEGMHEDIEHIRDEYWLPAGYNVSEISALNGGNASDVGSELNKGQHIVYYTGHGVVNAWERVFYDYYIPELTNERRLPAIFSMACSAGQFDHPDKDSLGEAFLKAQNGAIAFFGASRMASGTNLLGLGLSEAVAELNIYTLGEIVRHIKLKLQNSLDIELYNLLGDPALDLGTPRRQPGKIDLFVSPTNISFEPQEPKQGEPVKITAVIHNYGVADAHDVIVELRDDCKAKPSVSEANTSPFEKGGRGILTPTPTDDVLIETHHIPKISAGGTARIQTLWQTPLGQAQHYIAIEARPEDETVEYYKDNNDAQKQLLVSLETEGWPVEVEAQSLSAPIAADVDGDGDMELLSQTNVSGVNKLYVWHHNGQPVNHWLKTINSLPLFRQGGFRPPPGGFDPTSKNFVPPPMQPLYTNSSAGPTPAVGDLDGDGEVEVVAVFFTQEVFAWRNDGSNLPGWPIKTSGYATTSPVLADMDNDGKLEIIVGLSDGQVCVYRYDGSQLQGWPVSVGIQGHLFPIVTDMDGDGTLEVVALQSPLPKGSGVSTSTLYAWHCNGTTLAGWPVQMQGASTILPPAGGDLNGDGTTEIVAVSVDGNICRLYVWKHDGSLMPGWPIETDDEIEAAIALGDMDRDGDVEIIACGREDTIYAWHHDSRSVLGWPVKINAPISFNSAPVLGNIDEDDDIEVAFTSHGGILYAYKQDGTPVSGWPAITESGYRGTPPVIADMDGDGRTEIAFASDNGRIHLLSLIGHHDTLTEDEWNMFLRNPTHTSSYDSKAILPLPPTNLTARDAPADEGNSIILFWQLSSDDHKAVNYVIYRSDNREGPYAIVGEVNCGIATYTDNSVETGVTYWYNVRTSDGRYLSANFDPVSVRPLNNFAPNPPETVYAQKGGIDNTINIQWLTGKPTPGSSQEGSKEVGIAGYKVYKGVSSKHYDEPIDVGMTNHYVLTGLTNGTVYYLSITAYDVEGNESLNSIEVTATPEDDDTEPPSFSAFYPKEVTEGIDFDIRCSIADPSGVYDESPGNNEQGIYLIWDDDGELSASSNKIPMSLLSPGIYKTDARIPGQSIGKQIVYQISAYDDDCDWNRPEDRSRGFSQEQIVNILRAPEETVLKQNYPNPFNPETWIPYELAKDSPVSIEIYNLRGQLVRRLELGFQRRDRYISQEKAAYWDGRNQIGERVASGIYFYVLRASDFAATRKMVILR
jgi:hypothetical protein